MQRCFNFLEERIKKDQSDVRFRCRPKWRHIKSVMNLTVNSNQKAGNPQRLLL